jgi:hypothetical protein
MADFGFKVPCPSDIQSAIRNQKSAIEFFSITPEGTWGQRYG